MRRVLKLRPALLFLEKAHIYAMWPTGHCLVLNLVCCLVNCHKKICHGLSKSYFILRTNITIIIEGDHPFDIVEICLCIRLTLVSCHSELKLTLQDLCAPICIAESFLSTLYLFCSCVVISGSNFGEVPLQFVIDSILILFRSYFNGYFRSFCNNK